MPERRLGRVEVYRGRGVQPWRYRVVAGNGEVTATSEGYASKSNVLRAARAVSKVRHVPIEDLSC